MFEAIITQTENLIKDELRKNNSIWIDLKTYDKAFSLYFINNYQYIEGDILDAFYIEPLNDNVKQKLLNIESIQNLSSDEQSLIVYLVTLHVTRRINMLSALSVGKDVTVESYKELVQQKQQLWYRGQQSFSFSLIPSYFRNKGDNGVVNKKKLLSDYKAKNINSKLNEIFHYSDLDFQKISFVQHTLSKTPFLDFTKDINVATAFAVEPDDKIEEDAALFVLDASKKYISKLTKETEVNEIIDKLNIEYYNNLPKVKTLISSELFNSLINGKVSSSFYLIDIQTNDRMRIQNGTFVLFNNVIFVNNYMIVSSNTKDELVGSISKHRILASDRMLIQSLIEKKSNRYKYQHLMNPYDYMTK